MYVKIRRHQHTHYNIYTVIRNKHICLYLSKHLRVNPMIEDKEQNYTNTTATHYNYNYSYNCKRTTIDNDDIDFFFLVWWYGPSVR